MQKIGIKIGIKIGPYNVVNPKTKIKTTLLKSALKDLEGNAFKLYYGNTDLEIGKISDFKILKEKGAIFLMASITLKEIEPPLTFKNIFSYNGITSKNKSGDVNVHNITSWKLS